jgi:hypothetical protein
VDRRLERYKKACFDLQCFVYQVEVSDRSGWLRAQIQAEAAKASSKGAN